MKTLKTIQLISIIILMTFPSILTLTLVMDNYKWGTEQIVIVTYLMVVGWIGGGILIKERLRQKNT